MPPLKWVRETNSLEISFAERELLGILSGKALRRALLALAAIGLLAHGRTIGFGFLGTDDRWNFVENERLRPPDFSSFKEIWSQAHSYLYIPVTETIWWGLKRVELALGGNFQYSTLVHGTEVLMHLLNTSVLYILIAWLARLYPSPGDRPAPPSEAIDLCALGGALLFLLHPVQTQTVATATGSKQVFALFPALLASFPAIAYFRFASVGALALATLLMAVAMLANPGMVVLPACFVLFAALVLKSPWRLFGVALASWLPLIAVTTWIGTHSGLDQFVMPSVPIWLKPFRAVDNLAFYLRQTLMPYPLLYDYGHQFLQRINDPLVWAEIAFVGCGLAILIAFYSRRRREPVLDFGAIWMVTAIVPALGFVPVLQQRLSDVADRYMYSWFVGLALVVAAGASRFERKRLGLGVAALTAMFVAATLWHQPVWSSEYRLYGNLLEHEPGSPLALWGLGEAYRKDGELEHAYEKYQEAYRRYVLDYKAKGDFSFVLKETVPVSYRNILAETGKLDELIAFYRQLANETPADSVAHFGLGNLLILKNNIDAGLKELEISSRLDPSARQRRFPPAEVLLARDPSAFFRAALASAVSVDSRYFSLVAMSKIAAQSAGGH